ncbi:hypothetical protein BJF79_10035 [Actinomadura sp. CNU-125]|uniref:hypothetical protein n=1 Tax=Actinomadura sp. CNU-125 TaxID=1904961 RepID=UPI00095E080C|nr:hypothetical protein [Actinomadura sp. CNU-125]OLT29867.1 hypothetical protein BJF79_10035 [Actinomadura sp. CNU-125]
MTRPGQPEDLDDPRLLWTRAAVMAVCGAAEPASPSGLSVDDDGITADIGGGSYWWKLTLAPDGEAVFSGRDADRSRTRLMDEPVPLLDGLPDRLSWKRLREDMERDALGFVYWHADGAWHRVDYPDDLEDDGLGAPLEHVAGDVETTDWVLLDKRLDDEVNARRAVADVLAKAHENTLRPADVTTMLGVLDPDVGSDAARTKAALDAAVRTGLLAGTRPPLIGAPAE